jgi:hypothetical protein
MSLRQCLRCWRMKREVKRGGICNECRKLVPEWRDPQSLVGQKHPPPIPRLRKQTNTAGSAVDRPASAELAERTVVTIICSHAWRGESASDWTLGFEGAVSSQQKREIASQLLKKFARVRVFVAKRLVDEFAAGKLQAAVPEAKRTIKLPPRLAQPRPAVSQSPSLPFSRGAGAQRLVKRVPLKVENQRTSSSPPVEKQVPKRIVGPYLEEPDY